MATKTRNNFGLIERTRQCWRDMMACRQGVSAVEFALVFPILVVVYLMAFELTIGFSSARKIALAASSVSDLVAQETSVNKTYLGTMDNVAQSIVAPYTNNGIEVKITGITLDANKDATVLWSWETDDTVPYAKGGDVDVPENLEFADSFLVHAEVSMPFELVFYLPGLSGTSLETITIYRDYYFRQRSGTNIPCSDCT